MHGPRRLGLLALSAVLLLGAAERPRALATAWSQAVAPARARSVAPSRSKALRTSKASRRGPRMGPSLSLFR